MTGAEIETVGPASGEELEQTWRLAQRLSKTEFVPEAFRGRAEAVLAAILTGRELNIGPMQSLSSINVIKGKPSLSPELMRALVLRAGHRFTVVEQSAESVTVEGSRRSGNSWNEAVRVTWTLEDAKRANLGAKDNWKQYPRAMLLARATSELCRQVFPDVIAGASYISEEVGGDYTPPANVDASTGEIVEVIPPEIAGGSSQSEPVATDSESDHHGQPLPTAARTNPPQESLGSDSPADDGKEGEVPPSSSPSPVYVDEFTIVAWRNEVGQMDADTREQVRKGWFDLWGSLSKGQVKLVYKDDVDKLIGGWLHKLHEKNRKFINLKLKEVGVTSDDARHELITKATKGAKKSSGKLSCAEATAVLEEIEALRLADGAA